MSTTCPAVNKLRKFIGANPDGITRTKLADLLGVSTTAVSYWIPESEKVRQQRPSADLRLAIEIITRGAVLADDWLTAKERTFIKRMRTMFSVDAARAA